MNEQLESDLRAALRERANLVPAVAADRLARLDYRPRTHRLRPPVAIGAGVSAAAAAAAVAVVISLGANASSAFAGWTAKPTKPAPGQLAAASAACQQSHSSVAGLPLALADTRGPFTFSVYANSESTVSCIQGPSFVALSESQSSNPVTVPAGRIELAGVHRSERGGQAFGFTYGRTGAGVSAVTLVLDDGTKVQATVANGWFVAWWPGAQQVKSAELRTPTGASTQTFNLPPGNLCNTNKDCPNGSVQNVTGGAGKGGLLSGSESDAGTADGGQGTGANLSK